MKHTNCVSGALITFLTTSDAADVDAIAAQIAPSDGTPGDREVGVVYFIHRALGELFFHPWPASSATNSRNFKPHAV